MLKQVTMAGLALAAVGMAGVVGSGAAVAADGGGGCGGTLVEYVPFTNAAGQKVGQLELYYNKANGNNCAIMLHGGPTWGVTRETGVIIAKSDTKNGTYTQAAYQKDPYQYQAGPIHTPGAGKCVYGGGGLTYDGSHHVKYTGFHCG